MYRKLQAMPGLDPTLIFLEASHAALVRRFSETRRPHPLAPDRSVDRGHHARSASKLNAIRAMADLIVDTSNLTVHELRDAFMRHVARRAQRAHEMVVTLVSFGFKHGLPVDADLVFDVRFLPNPHFVDRAAPADRPRRARSSRFMRRHAATGEFLDRLTSFLRFPLPHYVQRGQELPDHRDRLHRRPAPVGDDRRGAASRSLGATSTACASARASTAIRGLDEPA